MTEYDLSDPYDLDLMHYRFDEISEEEWEGYIEKAIERKKSFKNINALKGALKKARMSKFFNDKMIRWVLSLVDELDMDIEDK